MMNVYLVKPDLKYFEQYCEIYAEWQQKSDHINPWFFKTQCKTPADFSKFIQMLADYENAGFSKQYASQSAYFAVDDNGRLISGASLRHYLTADGYNYGGHIGYGVRPSERKKGYATQILKLTLQEAETAEIYNVLLCALETNIASNKVILNCGGVLENKVTDSDGSIINRYRIHIAE